jgi:uncharacterized protein (DUF433 family)
VVEFRTLLQDAGEFDPKLKSEPSPRRHKSRTNRVNQSSALNLVYSYHMEPTLTNKQHIESRPGVCGGKPCIAGTRIRVQDIYVWHELHGRTPEEIVSDFPQLTLAHVHAALAFYFDHREEIHEQMKKAEEFAERMKAESGPGILDKFRARLTDDNSVSS